MKKNFLKAAVLLAAAVLLVAGFLWARQENYDAGKAQGYLTGYSIGYTDGVGGREQNSQLLAGEMAPYRYGNSRWKGFMIGFPQGYGDGLSAAG
jgi:hypothetical protein